MRRRFGGGCNKQCFTLYCCLTGPKFPPLCPWSSNAMCCTFTMFIFSLVHQREEGAKKSDDSPILAVETLSVLGTVAETRKVNTSILKKSRVNVMMSPMCAEEANSRSPQQPGVPKDSTKHAGKPCQIGSRPYREHPFPANFPPFSPSFNPCGAAM